MCDTLRPDGFVECEDGSHKGTVYEYHVIKLVGDRTNDTKLLRMPHALLLHLPRIDPDKHATLAAAALKPAHDFVAFTLIRVPTHVLPKAMRDLASDEALCVQTSENLPPTTIKALHWAVHKRFNDPTKAHAQLRCDLIGGDESRLKKPKHRRRRP